MSKVKTTVQSPNKSNKSKGVMTADDYSHMELREYIYFRPDTYAGSEDKNEREEWVLVPAIEEETVEKQSGSPSPSSVSSETDPPDENVEVVDDSTGKSEDAEAPKEGNKLRMIKQFITLPEVIDNIFNEILSNAADNIIKSNGTKFSKSSIEITMDAKTITIKNGGMPMPIEIHSETKVYVPEMVFGILNSSSNYNDSEERKVSGRNGVGAKLTNIFSKEFSIVVADSIRKKIYKQTWRKNMTEKEEPVIERYDGEPYVQVSYTLDFARFKYEEYPEEAFNLFARYAADVSFTCKTPVYFNGLEFQYYTWQDYGQLYFRNKVDNCLVHYQWPDDVKTKFVRGVELATSKHVLPYVELYILDTPDEGETISFVNGRMSREGGVHVNACLKELSTNLLTAMNTDTSKGKAPLKANSIQTGKPRVREAAKDDKTIKLTSKDVKDHVTIILSCFLVNPKYKTQNKSCLSSPTPKIKIPVDRFNIVRNWQLIDRLNNELKAKEMLLLKSTDSTGRAFHKIEKGEHANWARKARSSECTLCIVEGDSASCYAKYFISAKQELEGNGKDLLGYYPARGKLLNVMNASAIKQMKNKILDQIKKMLGLKDLVDYTLDEHYKTMNYGFILIMSDADDDGRHITGLLLNFFYMRFRGLLKRGCIAFLRTPVIRAKKGKNIKKFYTQASYNEWKDSTPDYATWNIKYCKGLASSNPSEVRHDFKDHRKVTFVYDDDTTAAMQLAFHTDCADARKRWIAEWQKPLDLANVEMKPISKFIQEEFIEYSVTNLHRGIGHVMDGLKPSQRKIVWGSYLKWKNKTNVKEEKVSILANFISGETHYRHGEKSLCDAIIRMAQDYVGSNNLPIFRQEGLVGTRTENGKDGGDARYVFVAPEWWLPYVFRSDDIPLLNVLEDDGHPMEPEFLLPVVPLDLINGSRGVGTGSASHIPGCNPLDVVNCIRSLLLGKRPGHLQPWYRNFKGTLEVAKQNAKVIKAKTDVAINVTNYQNSTKYVKDVLTPEEIERQFQLENKIEEARPVNEPLDEEKTEIEEVLQENMNNFEGNITYGNKDHDPKYSVITTGVHEVRGNKVIVTELPIGVATHDYWIFINNLAADKQINDFNDQSTTDIVHFEILGFRNPNVETLRLQSRVPMSNMVLLSPKGIPIRYNTLNDILQAFYELRLPYYGKRKEYMLQQFTDEMKKKTDKMRFIQAYIEKKIRIKNRKDEEVSAMMAKLDLPETLLNMSLKSLTKGKIAELKADIENDQKLFDALKKKTPEEIWLQDLDEFESEYNRHYNTDGSSKDNVVTKTVKKRPRAAKGKGKKKTESDTQELENDDEE